MILANEMLEDAVIEFVNCLVSAYPISDSTS
jgi:hypothetical protein